MKLPSTFQLYRKSSIISLWPNLHGSITHSFEASFFQTHQIFTEAKSFFADFQLRRHFSVATALPTIAHIIWRKQHAIIFLLTCFGCRALSRNFFFSLEQVEICLLPSLIVRGTRCIVSENRQAATWIIYSFF